MRAAGQSKMILVARDIQKVSPRIRMAARLYATGAAPTKKAAARAAGIHPAWFGLMSNHNEETRRLVDGIDAQIEDQSVEMSTVLRTLGRVAIGRIKSMMYSAKDEVALKAAQDLADRSPETSKVQKIELASMHITSADAKELANSLVEAAALRQRYAAAVQGDFVRVDTGERNGSQGQLTTGREVASDAETEESCSEAEPEEANVEHEAPPTSAGT